MKVNTEAGPTLVNQRWIDLITPDDRDPGKTILGIAGGDAHISVDEPFAEVERRILYGVFAPQPGPGQEGFG